MYIMLNNTVPATPTTHVFTVQRFCAHGLSVFRFRWHPLAYVEEIVFLQLVFQRESTKLLSDVQWWSCYRPVAPLASFALLERVNPKPRASVAMH